MTTPRIVGPFVKATASGQNGNCVEVAMLEDGGRAVRHSKHPDVTPLYYSAEEWKAFIIGAKAGEFDA
jgi:hypothetical protein